MVYQDKFSVGDKVTWRNEEMAMRGDARRSLGNGPFTVLGVVTVPVKGLRSVGHSQWLLIDGWVNEWSGAYFRKVEEKHG